MGWMIDVQPPGMMRKKTLCHNCQEEKGWKCHVFWCSEGNSVILNADVSSRIDPTNLYNYIDLAKVIVSELAL